MTLEVQMIAVLIDVRVFFAIWVEITRLDILEQTAAKETRSFLTSNVLKMVVIWKISSLVIAHKRGGGSHEFLH